MCGELWICLRSEHCKWPTTITRSCTGRATKATRWVDKREYLVRERTLAMALTHRQSICSPTCVSPESLRPSFYLPSSLCFSASHILEFFAFCLDACLNVLTPATLNLEQFHFQSPQSHWCIFFIVTTVGVLLASSRFWLSCTAKNCKYFLAKTAKNYPMWNVNRIKVEKAWLILLNPVLAISLRKMVFLPSNYEVTFRHNCYIYSGTWALRPQLWGPHQRDQPWSSRHGAAETNLTRNH